MINDDYSTGILLPFFCIFFYNYTISLIIYLELILLMIKQTINISVWLNIIVAPLGISNNTDTNNPIIEPNTPNITEYKVILKNVLLIILEEAAGITKKAEINTIPTSLMDITIVVEIKTDSI